MKKKRTKLFLLSMLSFKLVKTLKIQYLIYLFKKKLIKISLVVFAFLSSYDNVEWESFLCLGKLSHCFLSLHLLPTFFFFCFQHFIPYIFSVMKCLQEFLLCEFFLLVSLPLGHFYPFIQPLSLFMSVNLPSPSSSGCMSFKRQ